MKIYEQTLATLKSLKVAEYNPRLMPEEEMANLKRALKEFGFVQPIVARKEDGLIIGGHQRAQAYAGLLKERGLKQSEIDAAPVPVVYVTGLDDSKTKLLNVALNKIHGEWDTDKLSALFGSLSRDTDVQLSGFSKDEVDGMLSSASLPTASLSLGNVAQDVEGALGAPAAPACATCDHLRRALLAAVADGAGLAEDHPDVAAAVTLFLEATAQPAAASA